jgi:hypothetical protein
MSRDLFHLLLPNLRFADKLIRYTRREMTITFQGTFHITIYMKSQPGKEIKFGLQLK